MFMLIAVSVILYLVK